MKKLLLLAMMGSAFHAQANEHTFPNITKYKNPYIHLIKLPSAKGQLIKAVQADGGDREGPNLNINRIEVGIMRERYDNKFANVGLFYATSESGEESNSVKTPKGIAPALPASDVMEDDAELQSQIGLYYENGIHLEQMDLSAFIEVATADVVTDGERSSDFSVGLGMRAMISLHKHVDLGATIIVSGHYSGGGLGIKMNF
jgi:hypothetical protein